MVPGGLRFDIVPGKCECQSIAEHNKMCDISIWIVVEGKIIRTYHHNVVSKHTASHLKCL